MIFNRNINQNLHFMLLIKVLLYFHINQIFFLNHFIYISSRRIKLSLFEKDIIIWNKSQAGSPYYGMWGLDWLVLDVFMTTRDHRLRWTPVSGPYFVLFLSFGKLRWFLMVSNYVITITYCRHYNKIFPSCFQRWKVWPLRASQHSRISLRSEWTRSEWSGRRQTSLHSRPACSTS